MSHQPIQTHTALDAPLERFSQCHQGFAGQLQAMAGLPALASAAQRSRTVAREILDTLDAGLPEHHAEEEAELFPAVLRSAMPGEEHDRVQSLVSALTAEHRRIEALWRTLVPVVKAAAAGKPTHIDAVAVDVLVRACMAHAAFEEQCFLPLAEEILGRNGNHMAALGLSIHMRHARQPVGYI